MAITNTADVLNRLETAMGRKKKQDGGNNVSYKELAELKKKSFIKLKEGKNNLVIVKFDAEAQDPFVFWGSHKNLQETSYWTIPCDATNKNSECIICNLVDDLQSTDRQGNYKIWNPIKQEPEMYAAVVNVESESTIAEGLKWLRIPKSIMTQFIEWIRNLEKGEAEFYDDDEPQKIIINYNKNLPPMEQYKLDKKNYKAFTESQLEQWRADLKPISFFIPSKPQEEVKKIIDAYLERVATDTAPAEETVEGKLRDLKK